MSTIHLEEVKLKNFLSYGSTLSTFKISPGLTLISGQNKDTSRSNGAGKSGLNESIVWSLAKQLAKAQLRYPAEDAPYELERLKRFGLE